MVFYGSRVDGVGDAAVRWLDSFFVRRLCVSRFPGSQGFQRFELLLPAGLPVFLAAVWTRNSTGAKVPGKTSICRR